jgi:outer membrane protein assembly factor BamB
MALAVVAAAGLGIVAGAASGAPGTATGNDWSRFGWSPSRSSAPTFATGITPANVRRLTRQQVQLDGTADSSPIYLHAVQAGGATHDVFFVTTTYGKTEAIDAASGKVLWRFTPPGYSSWAGSAQITTATPVADPGRTAIYAASPGGQIYKLAVGDGHAMWSATITKLPSREKIAASLNYAGGHVIATTGGYIGDAPPYQGHVALIDPANGRVTAIWNSLCSDRHALISPDSCPASDSAIWGRAGAVVDPATGDLLVATGNAPWDGHTNWGDATLLLNPGATKLIGNYTPSNTADLNAGDVDIGSTSPVVLSPNFVAQGGKDGRIRHGAAQGRRGPDRLDAVRH